jgi:hypothetical protein
VDAIKAGVQRQQKFLGELIEQASRWELQQGELQIYFPSGKRSFAEMLEGREPLAKLRAVASEVLASSIQVRAKLEGTP